MPLNAEMEGHSRKKCRVFGTHLTGEVFVNEEEDGVVVAKAKKVKVNFYCDQPVEGAILPDRLSFTFERIGDRLTCNVEMNPNWGKKGYQTKETVETNGFIIT